MEIFEMFKLFAEQIGFESVLSQVGLLIFALFTFFKGMRFVKEGERGLKLRFGKVVRHKDGRPKVMEPGFIILIPYVESLVKRHVRQQPIPLDEQVITLKSGLTFRVAGILFIRVEDIYKALFDISDLDLSVKEEGMGRVRDIVAGHEDHSDLAETEKIAETIKQKIREKTDSWGVLTEDFRITVCAPTPESAVVVNLAAAAKQRIDSIKLVSEQLGVPVTELVESGLASVLVGAPLVSQASSTSVRKSRKLPEGEDKKSLEITMG